MLLTSFAGEASRVRPETGKSAVANGGEEERGSPAAGAAEQKLVPLDIRLPCYSGVCFPRYPRGWDGGGTVERIDREPRPPFIVPVGTRNVALSKPVTASHDDPIIGKPEMVTDGDKECRDESIVELLPGLQ